MVRQTAILAMAFGAIVCCGCGDSAASAPAVAARSSAPPKPAPPPSGLPGESEAKPGVEAPPVQLGGPQIRQLLGTASAADTTSATAAGPSPSPTASQPGPSADPSPPTESPATAAPPAASGPAPSNPTDGSRSGRPPRRRSPAPAPSDAATPPADPSAPTNGPNVGRAEVGVGAQGKNYGNADGGYISGPISTYFNIRENIAFNIEIPRAMKFFEANKQRKPNSNEEFMKEIIKEYNIKLPELTDGKEYWYDAKQGELKWRMPERRAK